MHTGSFSIMYIKKDITQMYSALSEHFQCHKSSFVYCTGLKGGALLNNWYTNEEECFARVAIILIV